MNEVAVFGDSDTLDGENVTLLGDSATLVSVTFDCGIVTLVGHIVTLMGDTGGVEESSSVIKSLQASPSRFVLALAATQPADICDDSDPLGDGGSVLGLGFESRDRE